jgi:hypothetical protein
MEEITKLKKELNSEWQKPKKKNLIESNNPNAKHKDGTPLKDARISRDVEKIKSLVKQINEEKTIIKDALAKKEKTTRKKEVENNDNHTKFLVGRDKRLSNIAKTRRQKRKQRNGK